MCIGLQMFKNWYIQVNVCPNILIKAGVNMNLSEILGSLKRDKKGKKRLWNTTRQLPDPTMTPQVVGQLFGVYLPIFNFKL